MKNRRLTLFTLPFKALGSLCELKLYLPSQKVAADILSSVVSVVNSYQAKYSRYDPNSLVSIINSSAGSGRCIPIDEETSQLLDYANVLYEQSDGLFDITSGILRKAWDFKSNTLPSQSELDLLVKHIGWNKVKRKEGRICLPYHEMEIDFGGFVKEYIADAIANHCVSLGVVHGLVNLGGDIHVIGPHLNSEPWVIGITHPRQCNKAITSICVSKGGIATSGDYERFMVVDGVRYCHILNPLTGTSILPKFASISVVADSCLVAGSFSTSAMLKSHSDNEWIKESSLPYVTVCQSLKVNKERL